MSDDQTKEELLKEKIGKGFPSTANQDVHALTQNLRSILPITLFKIKQTRVAF